MSVFVKIPTQLNRPVQPVQTNPRPAIRFLEDIPAPDLNSLCHEHKALCLANKRGSFGWQQILSSIEARYKAIIAQRKTE